MHGEVVNIAGGQRITVNQVLDLISQSLDIPLNVNYVDRRPGDIEHSCADITLAKDLLGYEPIVEFDEGLQVAVDFYDDGKSNV